MIAANELRIGNWLRNGSDLIQVDGFIFWHYQFPNDATHIVEISQLKPIPITPEILIACGLEEANFKNQYRFCGHFLEDNADGTFSFIAGDDEIDIANVRYLHQLQNLFYSLTNTELVYKP